MTNVLLVISGVLVAVALHDLLRRPVLRRQAMRNLVRRPGEAALMTVGALLGTAIITASFVVGDTVDATIRDVARTNLGPIDETIVIDDALAADTVWDSLVATPIEGVDGLLRATTTQAATSKVGPDGSVLADPRVSVFEIDFDSARAFGLDAATGLEDAGSTPEPGTATISEPLAETLEASVGDTVRVYVYGQQLDLEVTALTPRVGLGGRSTDNVHVSPGTLDSLLAAAPAQATFDEPTQLIYVSNDGGVFDSVGLTASVVEQLDDRIEETGVDSADVEVGTWKRSVLEDAEAEGDEFTTIFSSIGAFAVISGLLLVVNIVVMLTDERRSQLGILRSLGLKRLEVVRLMGLEGTAYALASTTLGVVVGIGVGWVVSRLTGQVFSQNRLNLVFDVTGASLLTSAAIGLLVTLLSVWLASVRVARMNVIAAIRDLESPRTTAGRLRSAIVGAATVAIGCVALALGAGSDAAVPALLSVPLIAGGVAFALRHTSRTRLINTAAGAVAVIWGIAVFSVLEKAMDNPEISVFVFQGVVMVTGAVAVLIANQSVWESLVRRVGTGVRGVALRLGLAYPLAKPGRSGMLLAMFSLVVFTITFMAVLVEVFDNEADSIANQTGAGFEVFLNSNASSPIAEAELLAVEGVDTVASLTRRWYDVEFEGQESTRPLTEIDANYLRHGGAELAAWSPDYSSQDDVWRAVIANPGKVVVDEFLFEQAMEPGARIDYVDAQGDKVELEVIGVVRADWLWNAVYGAVGSHALLGYDSVSTTRYFASGTGSIDAQELTARINGTLLARGVEAESIESIIAEELSEQNSFIRILQGYLGLGLLIGVAGLGIVLIRAVRERRREIGMLRAMGYRSATIRHAFLAEATFVSMQGAIIGVALGMITAWQVVTNVDAFAAGDMDFAVPWTLVAVIAIGPVLASLAAAAWPAQRASQISPAVALRVTG